MRLAYDNVALANLVRRFQVSPPLQMSLGRMLEAGVGAGTAAAAVAAETGIIILLTAWVFSNINLN